MGPQIEKVCCSFSGNKGEATCTSQAHPLWWKGEDSPQFFFFFGGGGGVPLFQTKYIVF